MDDEISNIVHETNFICLYSLFDIVSNVGFTYAFAALDKLIFNVKNLEQLLEETEEDKYEVWFLSIMKNYPNCYVATR